MTRHYHKLVIYALSLWAGISTIFYLREAPPMWNLPAKRSTASSTSNKLQEQLHLQTDFQHLIHRTQHPLSNNIATSCADRRMLLFHPPEWGQPTLDGFTLELQLMGRFLQVAVATDRTLVVPSSFQSAYAPSNCTDIAWNCLYEPLSECTQTSSLPVKTKQNRERIKKEVPAASTSIMGSVGIIHDNNNNNNNGSPYFDAKYYGPQRVVDEEPHWLGEPDVRNVDRIEYWERAMGRFWIRSQLAHYLWKPNAQLQLQMQQRMPSISEQYIGLHIRYSDNIGSLERDFGRNATVTRSIPHFMDIANTIRQDTGISHLYVATDSNKALQALQHYIKQQAFEQHWTLHLQHGSVDRTDGQEWTWFKGTRSSAGAAIATDVEMLRQADYLVGSFQSNVYRLATELNVAYHVEKYPWIMRRHYTVDIEWYEAP